MNGTVVEETDIRITYIDPPDPPSWGRTLGRAAWSILAGALGGAISTAIVFGFLTEWRDFNPFPALAGSIVGAACGLAVAAIAVIEARVCSRLPSISIGTVAAGITSVLATPVLLAWYVLSNISW